MRTCFTTILFFCFVNIFPALSQTPTVITQHPLSAHVCESQPLILTVKANGTNLTYQWQKDNITIPGANDFQYVVTSASQKDAGVYKVLVSGSGGAVTSQNAVIYVDRPVSVIHQPENFNGIIGSTAEFTAEFEVSEPVIYQWYSGTRLLKDNGRITGANSSVLTIRNIQPSDTVDAYYVTATALCGSATSNPARIIWENISIVIHQEDEPCVGEGIPFELKATVSHSIPLQFDWFFKNNKLENGLKYQGVNTQNLTVLNSVKSDSGEYTLIASNDQIGFADTLVFTPEYNIKPEVYTIGGLHACVDSSYTVILYMKEAGEFTVEMYLIDPYTNEEIPVVLPTNFKGKNFAFYKRDKAEFSLTGNYKVYVRNACGTAIRDERIYIPPSTKVSVQPIDTLVLVSGKKSWLNIAAIGCENEGLTYQLYKNGVEITGKKTIHEFEFSDPTIADTGHYFFVVRGHCGVDTSKTSVVIFQEPSDVKDNTASSELQLQQNNPNPFSNETSIRYFIPAASPVSIIIRDVFGRVLKTMELGMRDAGSYAEVLKSDGLAEGMYFYTLQTNTAQITRSFTILK
ncbi:MAG: T9SS type A sorting domain-containing protein [Bacteroidota bacterium]